jgi:hypothetical protein
LLCRSLASCAAGIQLLQQAAELPIPVFPFRFAKFFGKQIP